MRKSAALPIGAANEDWISYEFTVPGGATSFDVKILDAVADGQIFYLNEIDVKPVVNEYQYAIADHQGNTRVVFSSVMGTPKVNKANMENSANAAFPNYANVFRSSLNLFDNTDAGTDSTYSNLLNGGNNQQIGVAKSYKVLPGDIVKIEAYAKYSNQTATTSNLTGFASALLSAFGASAPVSGEVGTSSAALNQYGTVVAGGDGQDASGPKAFVNIIVFDKNYKFLDMAYEAIDPAAEQVGASPNVPHDYMMREYTVKEAGYVFMYVSNENPTRVDVYFDDITMTHTPGNVIQYNEYYPFGMRTANSWDRVEEKPMTSMTTNLVAKITFEGNTNDLSGNGNNATASGGAALTTVYGRPNAIFMDGTDDYLQIADNASLDFGTGNFTMAFWAKKLAPSSAWDNSAGLQKWNSGASPGTNEWAFNLTSNTGGDNKPTINVEMGSVTKTASSPEDITTGRWHHIVALRQGNLLKLYVNGVLKATTDIGTGAINNVGRDLQIGKYLSGFYANAVYDDIYIYNRALSEEELRYLYLDKPELMVNNYMYNSGSEFNDAASWYETSARGYDPVLGRMNGVDPMAGKYSSLSPYNFAFNMPSMVSDPSGADPMETAMWYEEAAQRRVMASHGMSVVMNDLSRVYRGGSMYAMFSQGWTPGGGGISYDYGNFGSFDGISENGGTWTINLNRIGDNGGTWNRHSGYHDFSEAESWSFTMDYAQRFGVALNNGGGNSYNGSLMMLNPWAGKVVGAGRYAGQLVRFDPYLAQKISAAGYGLFLQQTQGNGPLQDFLSSNFGSTYAKYSSKVNWILDTKEEFTKYNEEQGTCTCGSTKGYYDKKAGTKVTVHINPHALLSFENSYLIIGHEFIHAMHRADGTRKSWNDDYGTTMGHNLSEYYAYQWQFKAAVLLGYPLGNVISQFNKFKDITKDVRQ